MAFKLAEAYVQFSQRGLSGVNGDIAKVSSSFSGAAGLATKFGALLVGGSLVAGAGVLTNLAMKAETTEKKFAVLLKSEEKAAAMIAEINQFADVTPFDNAELAQSAQLLLAFKVPDTSLLDHLANIGDVAALTGTPIKELSELYGKANVQGTLYAEDLNQLLGRGIPILDLLAKQLGLVGPSAGAAVKKMASEGLITKDHMIQAFQDMTSAGGDFENGMAQLAQTSEGKLSTFWGKLKQKGVEVGSAFLPLVSGVLDFANSSLDGSFLASSIDMIKGGVENVTSALSWVKGGVSDVASVLSGPFNGALELGSAFLSIFWQGLGKAGGEVLSLGGYLGETSGAFDAAREVWGFFTWSIGKGVAFISDLFETFLARSQYVARNFSDLWELAKEDLLISFQNTWNAIDTWGTNVVEVGSWVLENWSSILWDFAELTGATLVMVGDNLYEFWQSVARWFSGEGWNFEFKGLDQFFEAKTELPTLTQRVVIKTTDEREQILRRIDETESDYEKRKAEAQRLKDEELQAEDDKKRERLKIVKDGEAEVKKVKEKARQDTIAGAEVFFNKQIKLDKKATEEKTKAEEDKNKKGKKDGEILDRTKHFIKPPTAAEIMAELGMRGNKGKGPQELEPPAKTSSTSTTFDPSKVSTKVPVFAPEDERIDTSTITKDPPFPVKAPSFSKPQASPPPSYVGPDGFIVDPIVHVSEKRTPEDKARDKKKPILDQEGFIVDPIVHVSEPKKKKVPPSEDFAPRRFSANPEGFKPKEASEPALGAVGDPKALEVQLGLLNDTQKRASATLEKMEAHMAKPRTTSARLA